MVELQALPSMNEVVAVEEAPEGGCGAGAVGDPVHTGAKMLPELRDAVRDAVRGRFEDDGGPTSSGSIAGRKEVIAA